MNKNIEAMLGGLKPKPLTDQVILEYMDLKAEFEGLEGDNLLQVMTGVEDLKNHKAYRYLRYVAARSILVRRAIADDPAFEESAKTQGLVMAFVLPHTCRQAAETWRKHNDEDE